MPPHIQAVSRNPTHGFSKRPQTAIQLLKGLGVEGDVHLGTTVQHLYHIRKDPTRPNLTQVHLIHAELFAEPEFLPLGITPGDMGENITTAGLDLHHLPTGTRLHLGETAVIQITGLRTPCVKMDHFRPGLMAASLTPDPHGNPAPRAGVMAIVLTTGTVHPNDPIRIDLPPEPHHPLHRL